MTLPRWITHASLLLTLAVFAFASLSPVDALWGINHGQYIPTILTLFLILITSVLVASSIGKHSDTGADSAVNKLAAFFWSDSLVPRWGFALGFVAVAYFLRVETHFLGDGYGWLWNFSIEYYYLHKWTEPIAMHTVRALQWTLGGFNQDTSLLAFRIISFTSGFIVILNLFAIFDRLCASASHRVLGMATFIFSGVVLQFCGYIEFYSPLWAAMTAFFRVWLTYDRDGTRFWLVIVTFLLSAALHLQALYLTGAVLFLLYDRRVQKFESRESVRKFYLILGILAALFSVGLVWLYFTDTRIERIFLPLFEGKPMRADYAILSSKHLFDMLNLVFLVFPGALALLALLLTEKNSSGQKLRGHFLFLCSVGSLAFLLMIDPVIGLARDWDLMSATLLPPALWIFHRFDARKVFISGRAILSYTFVCVLLTGSFVAANVGVRASEKRYHSLLKYYGSNDRSGWVVLVNYLTIKEDFNFRDSIDAEMAPLFPQDSVVNKILDQLRSGQSQSALSAAKLLYESNPFILSYLQLLANCYGKAGSLDSSIYYYTKATKLARFRIPLKAELGEVYLKSGRFDEALEVLQAARRMDPHNETYNEGVGMAFLRLGQIDSTSAVAKALLERDSLSVSGHLLALMVASESRDKAAAKHHYELFKQTGKEHSSYRAILDFYKDVVK